MVTLWAKADRSEGQSVAAVKPEEYTLTRRRPGVGGEGGEGGGVGGDGGNGEGEGGDGGDGGVGGGEGGLGGVGGGGDGGGGQGVMPMLLVTSHVWMSAKPL